MRLKVTADNARRLSVLGSLSPEAFEELLAFFESSLVVVGGKKEFLEGVDTLTACPSETAFDIGEAILPLLYAFVAEGEKPAEVAAAVVDGIRRQQRLNESGLATTNLAQVKKRLLTLLGSETLSLKAKAASLVQERPCVLDEARIISDLRPVFGFKSLRIQAMTVLHTLVLECYEGTTTKSYHIALDASDLSNLKQAIERAEGKAKELSKLVSSTGITNIEVT